MKAKNILTIFLTWLIIVNFFAYLALNRLNLNSDTAYPWMSAAPAISSIATSVHARWDSLWYLDIAHNGYSYKGVGQLSNLVFLPLYPLLIKVVSFVTLQNYVLAGWLVSAISLFFALFMLSKIVKEFHKSIDPFLPVAFLLIFPTAFFLNTVYSESLFLFLSLAVFYFALKRNFLWAGIFGFLAALTRVTGVLLFIPVIWEYFSSMSEKGRPFRFRDLTPAFLIPLGTAVFMFYEYLKFGDFYLMAKVESWWGRGLGISYNHFVFLTSAARANFIVDFMILIFTIVVAIFVFKRLRISYGLYLVSFLLVIFLSGTLMSVGRYVLVLFPIYILAASLKNKYLQFGWALLSVLLLAMNIILFVNNYWAG